MNHKPLLYIDRKKCGISTLGNCKGIWFAKKLCLTIGPNWWYNVLFLLIYLGLFSLYLVFISKFQSLLVEILGLCALSLCLLTYLMTAFLNPGIALRNADIIHKRMRHCEICDDSYDLRAHHCELCGVCVIDIDHHCNLIGKCIGKGNIITFYAHLLSLLLLILFAFYSLAAYALSK